MKSLVFKVDSPSLTYREIHFPNEYVIVKRLEEKNHLIHQNRFSVDHYFRPLKLQYQTIRFVSSLSCLSSIFSL
jgi:hypothetical protein